MPGTLQKCEYCGGDLPVIHRSDRRYCSNSHRVLAARARKRVRDAELAAVQQARIPAELTSRPRWVRHKDKVPMRVDGRFASVKDPSSWSDYRAVAASRTGDGMGFVLTAGDGIVVVDLDHAVEDGRVLPWAQAIVDQLPPTYMERGCSGEGLHLWFRGAVPHGRRIRRGELAVEVYSDRRYMIVGDRVPGTPLELAELPDAAGLIASLS
ncbi:bifunctional DNA primase/polymerase [Streptomyces sp. NBC_00006]|uniref:bifunctional DNA primase/polymerase n=1 Tax=Streptomyces sp. NBC_00006 TaxID=2975619 RepID=UPI002254F907|nr:bifunctional DNA primase/polymerase [Streptomyces sp. NBC_00006]MCX5537733.1 bifunctional DNA primase/polymerase [Streptomyces sp. NBC_00006]MCX5537856.1 bifunctional DNA primase/polymerase [Streptomyces sp. NBC_00006]